MRRFFIAFMVVCLLLAGLADGSAAAEQRPTLRAPVDAPINDPFRAPSGSYGSGNRGIEYLTTPGQQVVAAADGYVVFSGSVAGTRVITIRHSASYQTTYLGFLSVSVGFGDFVSAGAPLGRSGSWLHFGFKYQGGYLDPSLAFGELKTRAWLVSPYDLSQGRSVGDRIFGGIGAAADVVGRTVVDAQGAVVGVFIELGDGLGWIVDKSGEVIAAGYQVGLDVLQIPLDLLADAKELALLLPDAPLEQLQDLWNIYSEYRRSQDECTPTSAALPAMRQRRIAVFVPGLGSSSDDLEEFAGDLLGYEDDDIVHFSYAGGAIPGTGEALGVASNSYSADDTGQDIRLSAENLNALLGAVQETNPGVPIDVIAHSQGGLVARHAIQNGAGESSSVENLVTLGTPHQGSPHAKTAIIANRDPLQNYAVEQLGVYPVDLDSPSLRQLVPGSAFLENLAKGEMPENVDLRSIGSRIDLIVPANMIGIGAHGELSIIDGIAHGGLPSSSVAMREVGLALAGMAPTCRGVFDFFLDQTAGETIEFFSAGLNLVQLRYSLPPIPLGY